MAKLKHFKAIALILSLTCVCGGPAYAGLGGSAASVQVDRAHLSASMATTAKGIYSVSAITLPNGGVTREFISSGGVVFAIAWHGPSRPDLRQLLGSNFDKLQSDNLTSDGRRTHRPLNSNRSDLIVHSGGRPGGFRGFAYLPQLVPPSFSFSDLQ